MRRNESLRLVLKQKSQPIGVIDMDCVKIDERIMIDFLLNFTTTYALHVKQIKRQNDEFLLTSP